MRTNVMHFLGFILHLKRCPSAHKDTADVAEKPTVLIVILKK